jgi:serine/threonine-protein kinase RIO1
VAEPRIQVELTASFIERLQSIEVFLTDAAAPQAYDELLDGLRRTVIPNLPPLKTPARLQSLRDECFIDSVSRQLMSGKEATVYVVRYGDETRCAKVYKEANNRSFRQAVDYTKNRKVKNSRQARAMAKGLLRPPGAHN